MLGSTEKVERGELVSLGASPPRGGVSRSAIKGFLTWPGGLVPYVLDPGLEDEVVVRIREVVDQWNALTIVRFMPATAADFNRVRFQPLTEQMKKAGMNGKAQVGFQGTGEQGIWFRPNAGKSLIRHEMGHAVGLLHEQSRTDRDDHVTINWDNVPPHLAGNFSTYLVSGIYGVDVGPYDVGSIILGQPGPAPLQRRTEPARPDGGRLGGRQR